MGESGVIGISGAGGLVGKRLTAVLAGDGAMVRRLPHVQGAFQLDMSGLPGCDAVIHLAGENLADGRWTPARKDRIYRSRIDTTRQLSEAMARLPNPPRVLVCASAVGIYGNRGDEELTEDSPSGVGFLAQVVRDWEAACAPARDAGIRVVNARFGVILAQEGGALAKMLPIFRLGLGGPLGSGRQWMSWVALDDVAAAIQFALEHDEVRGPINVTSPRPVCNREFARALGQALHRPAFLPVPATLLEWLKGEMAGEMVLAGQRALPKRLVSAGFQFQYPELGPALTLAVSPSSPR